MRKFSLVFILYTIAYLGNAQVNIEAQLLLHYSFNNSFEDASSNNFHGTNDGVSFTEDRNLESASAINCEGESLVKFPNDASLKPNFPFAYAFWYNPRESSDQSLTNYGILTTDHSIDQYAGAWCTLNLSNQKMGIAYGDGGFSTSSQDRRTAFPEYIFNYNEWHHVVANYISPAEVEVFVNGCKVELTYSGTGELEIAYSDNPGAIGVRDNSTNAQTPLPFYEGFLDEFYFWSRNINQEEVSFLYDNFYDDVLSSTVEYQGCDENFSVTVNGVNYNIDNPTGVEYIETENACDSVINVNLVYLESTENILEYMRCAGDGFEIEINGAIFNEENPEGIQNLVNSVGCDSTLTVSINFEDCEDCLGTTPSFNLQINKNDGLFEILDHGVIIHERLNLAETISTLYLLLENKNQDRNMKFKQSVSYSNVQLWLYQMNDNTSLKL